MKHAFEFTYDIPFVKNALRRDLLWKGYLAAGIFIALIFVIRWSYGYFDPVFTTAFGIGSVVMVWRIHAVLDKGAKRVCELWDKLSSNRQIRYELDDEGFVIALQESRSRYEWSGLRRLWRYDDVWLIEIVKMQSAFFPPDQVSDEVKEYITQCCQKAGVRT